METPPWAGGGGEGGRESSQDPPSAEKLRMRSAASCTPPSHPHNIHENYRIKKIEVIFF